MRFVCILFLLAAAVLLAALPGCLSSTGLGAKARAVPRKKLHELS